MVDLEWLEKEVNRVFKIPGVGIVARRRTDEVAVGRRAFWWIACVEMGNTMYKVGHYLARDPSTVFRALERCDEEMAIDVKFRRKVISIVKTIISLK